MSTKIRNIYQTRYAYIKQTSNAITIWLTLPYSIKYWHHDVQIPDAERLQKVGFRENMIIAKSMSKFQGQKMVRNTWNPQNNE